MLQNARFSNSLDSCFVYEKSKDGNIDTVPFPKLDTTTDSLKLKAGNDNFNIRGIVLEVVPKLEAKVSGPGYFIEPQGTQNGISYRVTFEDET